MPRSDRRPRASHVELLLADRLRVGLDQLPAELVRIKTERGFSYTRFAEYLTTRRKVPVSPAWLHRYMVRTAPGSTPADNASGPHA